MCKVDGNFSMGPVCCVLLSKRPDTICTADSRRAVGDVHIQCFTFGSEHLEVKFETKHLVLRGNEWRYNVGRVVGLHHGSINI